MINVKAGIMNLGAQAQDIIEIHDADFPKLSQLFRLLNTEVTARWENERALTLIFVYYAGHGVMENYTYAMLNDCKKIRYPIEKQMRNLGINPGVFVLGVLDCCRENFQQLSRGTGQAEPVEEEDLSHYRNMFITHGCAPNSGVDARSTISVEYFKKLSQFAKPDGSVIIPGRMTTWMPGNGGEHVPIHQNELKLTFVNTKSDNGFGNLGKISLKPKQAAFSSQNVVEYNDAHSTGSSEKRQEDPVEAKAEIMYQLREMYSKAKQPDVMFKLNLKPI